MKSKFKILSAVCIIMGLLAGIGSAADIGSAAAPPDIGTAATAAAPPDIGSTGISFSTDKKVYEQGETIIFKVTNTGKSPIYVLDQVVVIQSKANVNTVLKISPGKSYSWNYDSSSLTIGKQYRGLIFWGKTKTKLQSLSTSSFEIIKPKEKVQFFSDKSSYKYKQNVKLTLKNNDNKDIYISADRKWKIKNSKGDIVRTLYKDCGIGYGGCFPPFDDILPKKSTSMIWNQKDDTGKYVAPGDYSSVATYTYNADGSGMQDIFTNIFKIKS